LIHIVERDAVSVVTLDRPDRRNALDQAHCEQLIAGIRGATGRVLVLRGEGPHFCAGADLTSIESEGFVSALHDALVALSSVAIPTIAAVQGAALGAGMQLAVACDLRVATPDARFGIPAARLGLMVDHWTVERVAEMLGHSPARAMLMAAEEYSGEAAHRLGFVHRIGDAESAIQWAGEIATLAPLTMAGHKQGLATGEGYRDAFKRAWASRDLQEGFAARAEKRPAQFEGR
jgi:enoyl-CoA hydratase